jgi:RimJ/RimL family protein N-acetyltransferase
MSQLPMLSAVQIAMDRVLLRESRDADREGLIELQTDPKVSAYIGGPRLRETVEQRLDAIGPANVTATPGVFVIADKAGRVGARGVLRLPEVGPGRIGLSWLATLGQLWSVGICWCSGLVRARQWSCWPCWVFWTLKMG